MTGKIIKIETALIARLPQANGEVWEVGRRRLNISIAELERKGERPELLLAVHASGQGGVVQANIVPDQCAFDSAGGFRPGGDASTDDREAAPTAAHSGQLTN